MKRHLTERELIEYRFRLNSDDQVGASAEHLADCSECREHLKRLNRKFAALDLLREDIHASEELISQAVEQARQTAPKKVIAFSKYRWVGAAAAVLVVGFVLLIGSITKEGPTQKERGFVRKPKSDGIALDQELDYPGKAGAESTGTKVAKDVPSSDLALREATTDTYDFKTPKDKRFVSVHSPSGSVVEHLSAVISEPISEQPPFAPASAIELVTLPRRDKVQLTIYNSADLTLVRERRNLTLKKGWNWLQFMWANTLIDPTSLSLEPLAQADKIDIQQLVFPARPEDEETMRLQGYVRVTNNSGEDYENAQTRLIVGKVHILDEIAELARRQYPYGRPGGPIRLDMQAPPPEDRRMGRQAGVWMAKMAATAREPKKIEKEGLSEYFLYTIEGTETIPTGWSKRLLSFDVDEVPVVNLYKYEEERYGTFVVRFLSFKNDKEHELGDTPIPGGVLKVYRNAGDEGHLSYTGQSSFKYIPVDEDVELNLGAVANVVVEQKLMDFQTENYRFDRRGDVSGWDEVRTFKIEIKNTRDIDVKVEIKRNFNTSYWDLKNGLNGGDFEKVDLDTVKFTLVLEPRSAKTFGYVLRTYHGTRQEDWREASQLRN